MRMYACVSAATVALIGGVSLGQPSRGLGLSATQIWDNNCASCHGERAQGVEGKAKSLLSDAKMDQGLDRAFFDLLRGGHDENDKDGKATAQEHWAVIVHLRELQHSDWRKRAGAKRTRPGETVKTQRASYQVEMVVAKGLKTPWSIDWLPAVDGKPAVALITEKDGKLGLYENGQLKSEIKSLPRVVSKGQGGLMDVAVHPEYASNGWVYLAFSEPSETGNNEMTTVVRGKIVTEKSGAVVLDQQQTIFRAKQQHFVGPGVHHGARIVFRKPAATNTEAAGRYELFFCIGERGRQEMAQDLRRPNGKIHRVWDDGKVPSDNPMVPAGGGVTENYTTIWSYGHRNPQGLAFDNEGNLWDTEHGPRGGDELNLVVPKANYGWPLVSFGINYSDAPFRTPWAAEAPDGTPITMPVYRWIKSIAACGLDCARPSTEQTFPGWTGDLFAGGLAGQNIDRLRLKDGALVEREEIFYGNGRVRDLAFGPDGLLYVVLNGPDVVVRLKPVK